MPESECIFCGRSPRYYLPANRMRFGFCENCKTYAIGKMADRIHRDNLTPDEAREEGLWIVVGYKSKEGGLPQYTGDFPLEWKEEAIKLAKL